MDSTVTVYLDDNELEFADGAFRCGLVVYWDEEGDEVVRGDLVDSSGFWSVRELVREVAGALQVPAESVLIAA